MSPRINSSWKGARKCLCKYRTFKCGMEYPSFVLNKAEQDQHQETKACQTKYIPFLSITMLQRTLLFTLSHHGNIVVLKLCSCRITTLIVEPIFKWILIITEINGYLLDIRTEAVRDPKFISANRNSTIHNLVITLSHIITQNN